MVQHKASIAQVEGQQRLVDSRSHKRRRSGVAQEKDLPDTPN
jgi:hypothetical protein